MKKKNRSQRFKGGIICLITLLSNVANYFLCGFVLIWIIVDQIKFPAQLPVLNPREIGKVLSRQITTFSLSPLFGKTWKAHQSSYFTIFYFDLNSTIIQIIAPAFGRFQAFCITIALITCVFCSLVNDWHILRIGWTIFLHFCVERPCTTVKFLTPVFLASSPDKVQNSWWKLSGVKFPSRFVSSSLNLRFFSGELKSGLCFLY